MKQPTPLKVAQKKPSVELVKALEILLAQANTGEIKGIAYAIQYDNDDTVHGWATSNVWNMTRFVGELHNLMTDLSTRVNEDREYE